MHLPEEELFDAVYALRRVLRPGGTLLVSVPAARIDVDPATRRDSQGRLFNDLPPAKIQLLFERVGFAVRNSEIVADSLARDGIQWCVTEFVLLDESAERPLHLVESILNRDKKDATYKLALFRALAEIAQTQHHLAGYTPEGKVKIPMEAIADKWMLYYWPIFESKVFIPQRTKETRGGTKPVAIRRPLDALIKRYTKAGGMAGFYTEEKMWCGEDAEGFATVNIISFPEVGSRAFKTFLPFVGSLAAGRPFHGLETGSLDLIQELDWVEVSARLARQNRFVVRVGGDSMEPTLRVGDLVVFEYHRSPRRDREIIIANLPEFGAGSHGTEAIKRITQESDCWIFQSDNPAYLPIRVSKNETSHPILGTMVEVLK